MAAIYRVAKQRIAEKHPADDHKIAEDDGDHRIPLMAQFKEFEGDHQGQQGDKGLDGQAFVGKQRNQKEQKSGNDVLAHLTRGRQAANQGEQMVSPHRQTEHGGRWSRYLPDAAGYRGQWRGGSAGYPAPSAAGRP
jgi:hypothetical protein